jgi:hypothetical protein
MEKAYKYGQMVLATKVPGQETRQMARAVYSTQMEMYTMVTGSTTKLTEKESTFHSMALLTRAAGP